MHMQQLMCLLRYAASSVLTKYAQKQRYELMLYCGSVIAACDMPCGRCNRANISVAAYKE